ncbi:MAG: UTP--glucose-phosphate uridylyltransferase [Clostridia bacterium]|jgi:UTP--glucose-1-phosphate uridylyltransferase|nr:UTP--glucose-phosphate uridylyltransferase [Clostridia bacterium]MDN5366387.1 UTP--glucose-phosphate uridylyltransferase [Thermacetogenium sp.]
MYFHGRLECKEVTALQKNKVRKAIIPAAGWGTRFLPATKAQPKEMLPIVDKPAIQYTVEEAVASGIEDIIIVTGRNKRAIEDHFDRALELEIILKEKGQVELLHLIEDISNLVDIHYVRQKEALGLGHAVYCARKFIGDEPFAVLLGDDLIDAQVPCLRQLLDIYEERRAPVLAIQQVPEEDVSRYGIIRPAALEGSASLFRVEDLVEKPAVGEAPSRYAVIGRYIITPEIFDIIETLPPGAGGEIQLTDALCRLAKRRPIYAYLFSGERYDVGDKLGFLQATVKFALGRPELGRSFLGFLRKLVLENHEDGGEMDAGESGSRSQQGAAVPPARWR